MYIFVQESSEHTIRLRFPTGLLLNRPCLRISCTVMKRKASDSGFPFTYSQLLPLLKILRACRKHFPDWTLVDVTSHDGERVLVRL